MRLHNRMRQTRGGGSRHAVPIQKVAVPADPERVAAMKVLAANKTLTQRVTEFLSRRSKSDSSTKETP